MTKIVLLCHDVIGTAMAGPAIRYWEFAKALAKNHEVTLIAPNQPDITPEGFQLLPYSPKLLHSFRHHQILITQRVCFFAASLALLHDIKIILDAYDPMPLENLEIFKHASPQDRQHKNRRITQDFNTSFAIADAFLCANERQRDLWLGMLMSLGKITPSLYDKDPSLKTLIDIVPFGLPSTPPTHNGIGPRQLFNIPPNDKIILWGGGIWNWFDPLTAIEAIATLNPSRPDIHLVFMGVKHPNPNVPEMEMLTHSVNLAKNKNLFAKNIHFNFGWTPYQQRQNFLLEANIGISTHFQHLETHYAFRTRILDYIWASLPIITTTGDHFAQLVEEKSLGLTVPYQNPEALAQAILQTLNNPSTLNHDSIRQSFTWDNVTAPIHNIIPTLLQLPPRRLHNLQHTLKALYQKYSPSSIAYHARKLLGEGYPPSPKPPPDQRPVASGHR